MNGIRGANELLSITQSAFESISRPRESNARASVQPPPSATNAALHQHISEEPQLDRLSLDSQSSTASDILKRSTNVVMPTRFTGLPAQPNAKLVRVPASILREVKSPLESESAVNTGRRVENRTSGLNSERTGPAGSALKNARKQPGVALSDQTTDTARQHNGVNVRYDSLPVSRLPPSQPVMTRPGAPKSNTRAETQATIREDEGKKIHPLIAMLDSGYLTQPIHTIVAEDRIETSESDSVVTSASPIDVLARDAPVSPSATGDSSYSSSSQPEIVTVPGRMVTLLPTAQPAHTAAPPSTGDSTDTEQCSSKPFIALKDRFMKFRPVVVKQGTETSDLSCDPTTHNSPSDELRIEQFPVDERHRLLRQALASRKAGTNAPFKKLVPAHVIPVHLPPTGSLQLTDGSDRPATAPTANSADTVASVAVAAVVATQTFLKSQQDLEGRINEILSKMAELQAAAARQPAAASQPVATPSEKYRKRLDQLESQLADLTRQRLDYLEKLHQQQLDVQMQLLAAARQYSAGGGPHVRGHTYDPSQMPSWARLLPDGGAPRGSRSDGSLAQDIEHEKASLLDTPAPRKRPPVPTVYQSDAAQAQSATVDQPKTADHKLLAEILARNEETPKKLLQQPAVGPALVGRQNMYQGSTSSDSQSTADMINSRLNPTRSITTSSTGFQKPSSKLNDTFSLTPQKRSEPTPLDKYLTQTAVPLINGSPYPTLKATRASHMPALLHYAEVEATLSKVRATSAQLETNLDLVMKSRQELDSVTDQTSLAERIRVRKLVDDRVKNIVKQLEVEMEAENARMEEAKQLKHAIPVRDQDPSARPRRPGVADTRGAVPRTARSSGDVESGHLLANKENIPKSTKIKKPRPLDPIEDEELMKRVYGRALYHKQRAEQKPACERYHASPKSKLPKSPVRISRAVVKGVEVATAKTQTSKSLAPPSAARGSIYGQFVVGLNGELIPVAIPVKLPRQRSQEQLSPGRQRSPPRRTLSPPARSPSPPRKSPPPRTPTPVPEDEEVEEEEEENTLSEDQPVISLPGHTAPPINYEGPEFPVREMPALPESRPAPSSNELAAALRRDHLQTEVIDWVEQELMARIICEMRDRGTSGDVLPHSGHQASVDESEAPSDAGDSVIADTIGQSGVQLFIDAGRPVDDLLVRALVREVLAEKISAMLGERAELDRLARLRDAASRVPPGAGATDEPRLDTRLITYTRSPVSTPLPTPVPSPAHSISHRSSPMSTPELSIAGSVILAPVAAAAQPAEDEFPSYTGMSESEHELEPAHESPFVERNDFQTPSITPSPSVTPSLRTPSPSQAPVLPVVKVAAAPTPVVVTADAATECRLTLPQRVSPPPVVHSPSPPTPESESVAPSTEEISSTNNECVSEGQWVVSLLSDGEVPDLQINDMLKQRIKQHLLNASQRPRISEDDDDTLGIGEDLEPDDKTDVQQSEGEILLPSRPLDEHIAMLDAFLPRRAPEPPLTLPARRSAPTQPRRSVERSLGEVGGGATVPRYSDSSIGAVGGSRQIRNGEDRDAESSSNSAADGGGLASSVGEYHKPRSPEFRPDRGPAGRDVAPRMMSPTATKTGQQQRPMPGRIMSTLEPSPRQQPRKFQPSLTGTRTLDLPRSTSPQQARAATGHTQTGSASGNQMSFELAGTATTSDVPTRTFTSDQMNMDSLLRSRDYLRQSESVDLGASANYSSAPLGAVGGPAGLLRSTYSFQRTGESMPTESFSDRNDAVDRWTAEDDPAAKGHRSGGLRATFEVTRPEIKIKMPAVGQTDDYVENSDDDISELSMGH